jgi:PAS domain S-box-containing protein
MTKGGVGLDVLLNATTRRDDQGNIIGVVGIGQDITGRLAQEREYTRLIDTANAPIFGVDTFGRVNVWNKCAMRLIGYTSEEVMGRSLVQEFIIDDFKMAVQAVFDKALAGDETDNFEFPLITKGRARIEVLLNATARRDEQGNVIGKNQVNTKCLVRNKQRTNTSSFVSLPMNRGGWNWTGCKLLVFSKFKPIASALPLNNFIHFYRSLPVWLKNENTPSSLTLPMHLYLYVTKCPQINLLCETYLTPFCRYRALIQKVE